MTRKSWVLGAAVAASLAVGLPAFAESSTDGIYSVSLINVLPSEMSHGPRVRALFNELIASAQKQPGLVQIKVTQQIGQPYNFTLIEQWKDQASLDAALASDAAKEFKSKLEPILSGPAYQRTFKAFN